jgi:2-C-methyl-D-erythritol 4-phosphate cytidylyltransferase
VVYAIIVAAGASRRAPGTVKKQFVPILGQPVIVHTLIPFQQSSAIDAIVCVVAKEDIPFFKSLIGERPLSKIIGVVAGGSCRQESVAAGLFFLSQNGSPTDWVAVHDGARPLITPNLIERVVQTAAQVKGGGAIAALPVTDSLKEVSVSRIVRSIPRESTWAAQTPQVFPLGLLMEAIEAASRDGFVGTDEAALVERIGGSVLCVEGADDNIKITTASDLKRAEIILGSR